MKRQGAIALAASAMAFGLVFAGAAPAMAYSGSKNCGSMIRTKDVLVATNAYPTSLHKLNAWPGGGQKFWLGAGAHNFLWGAHSSVWTMTPGDGYYSSYSVTCSGIV